MVARSRSWANGPGMIDLDYRADLLGNIQQELRTDGFFQALTDEANT